MNPISLSNAGPMSGTGNSPAPVSAAAASGSQVTKNMFLQLLVAQIKNQDPMSPTDGVQFLTQLAQFQQLEQSMNSGQDLTAIAGRPNSASTMAIRTVGYASHVQTDVIDAARQAGVDEVMARSAFTARLAEILASAQTQK